MTSKPNFPNWVRNHVLDAQNSFCKCCLTPIAEFHHRMPNTVTNQRLYPLFLQSPFNCVGLCRGCHGSSKIYQFKITHKEAAVYELYLQMLFKQSGISKLWIPADFLEA